MLTQVNYNEIHCKKVLDNIGVVGTRLWTRHCFDPYVNCEFGCVYCNSRIGRSDNHLKVNPPAIYIKVNSPEVLTEEFRNIRKKGVVNMGAATDIYQPIEEKYCITRRILEVFNKHACPFALGTKSDLILRDLDIISEASKKIWCCVSISLTTTDEGLAKLLEPNAPPPKRRLEVLKKLSEEGIAAGIWFTPILPYITDDEENMAKVIESAIENLSLIHI